MKLEKQRKLSQINKDIKRAQAQLATAFDDLHRLHHERGALLFPEAVPS